MLNKLTGKSVPNQFTSELMYLRATNIHLRLLMKEKESIILLKKTQILLSISSEEIELENSKFSMSI